MNPTEKNFVDEGAEVQSFEKYQSLFFKNIQHKKAIDINDLNPTSKAEMNRLKNAYKKKIQNRDLVISRLKSELKDANNLLALNSADMSAIGETSGRNQFSVSRLYSMYEDATNRLNLSEMELKMILSELELKVPIFKEQGHTIVKLTTTNQELHYQLDTLNREKGEECRKYDELNGQYLQIKEENRKLKWNQFDLGRQIQILLQKTRRNSEIRNCSSTAVPENISDVITFSDINELQSNNQKLLLLVRDLTDKLQKLEQAQEVFCIEGDDLLNKIRGLESGNSIQKKKIANLVRQRDTFKHLCDELMGDTSPSECNQRTDSIVNSNIEKLSSALDDYTKQLSDIKKEYATYRSDMTRSAIHMQKEFQNIMTENEELRSSNNTLKQLEWEANIDKEKNCSNQQEIRKLKDHLCNVVLEKENMESKFEIEKSEWLSKVQTKEMSMSLFRKEFDHLEAKCKLLQDHQYKIEYAPMSNEPILENVKALIAAFNNRNIGNMEKRLYDALCESSALQKRLFEEDAFRQQCAAEAQREIQQIEQKYCSERSKCEDLRKVATDLNDEVIRSKFEITRLKSTLDETLSNSALHKANYRIKLLKLQSLKQAGEIEMLLSQLNQQEETAIKILEYASQWENHAKNTEDIVNQLRIKDINTDAKISTMEAYETQLAIQNSNLLSDNKTFKHDIASLMQTANMELSQHVTYKNTIAELQAQLDHCNAALNALQTSSESKILQINDTHNQELKKMQQSYEGQIAMISDQHLIELQGLNGMIHDLKSNNVIDDAQYDVIDTSSKQPTYLNIEQELRLDTSTDLMDTDTNNVKLNKEMKLHGNPMIVRSSTIETLCTVSSGSSLFGPSLSAQSSILNENSYIEEVATEFTDASTNNNEHCVPLNRIISNPETSISPIEELSPFGDEAEQIKNNGASEIRKKRNRNLLGQRRRIKRRHVSILE